MENPYKYDDKEPNLFLRKCRNILGYGLGWTFWEAFIDWVAPLLIMLVLASVMLFLALHLKIEISFR